MRHFFFIFIHTFPFFPCHSPCCMQRAAFSWATVASRQSGNLASRQAGNSYHFFALTPECHRESETETETVTETGTAMGRQSAQSGSSLLLLAFID